MKITMHQQAFIYFFLLFAVSSTIPGAMAALRLKKSNTNHKTKKEIGNNNSNSNSNSGSGSNNQGLYLGALVTIDHVEPPPEGIHFWDKGTPVIEALIKADGDINPNAEYRAMSGFVGRDALVPHDKCPTKTNKNNKGPLGESSINFRSSEWGLISNTFIYWVCKKIEGVCHVFPAVSSSSTGSGGDASDNESFLATQMLMMERIRNSRAHKVYEEHVCSELRKSGAIGFGSITVCSIDYFIPDPDEVATLLAAGETPRVVE